MYVLGVNNGHDRAAVLLDDGRVVVGIEQERLDRKKHSSSHELPWEAIRYCLKYSGITLDQLDLVAATGLWSYDELGFLLSGFKKYIIIPHHIAHAYSAFYSSSFKDAYVLVCDGTGVHKDKVSDDEICAAVVSGDGFEAESIYHFRSAEYQTLEKKFAPNPKYILSQIREGKLDPSIPNQSVGNLYSSFSTYIFGDWRESGKVMGLAAYGDLGQQTDAQLIEYFDNEYSVKGFNFFEKILPSNITYQKKPLLYANLAHIVQDELERIIPFILNKHVPSESYIAFSGGVAMNCALNGKILLSDSYLGIHIPPSPGDSGTALGAAYFGYFNELKGTSRVPISDNLWGREYTDEEISDRIFWYVDRHYLRSLVSVTETDDVGYDVARLIVDGLVVGWFQGKSEFGPRALGSRSILSDPRNPEMKDIVNIKVKGREPFRPFSPSIMKEYVSEYTLVEGDFRFMSFSVPIKLEKISEIPSTVHVDGTARIQSVYKRLNPKFYSVIENFNKITNVPVILNTSFNLSGEPIVETPEDAFVTFWKSGMDRLSIGKYIFSKR